MIADETIDVSLGRHGPGDARDPSMSARWRPVRPMGIAVGMLLVVCCPPPSATAADRAHLPAVSTGADQHPYYPLLPGRELRYTVRRFGRDGSEQPAEAREVLLRVEQLIPGAKSGTMVASVLQSAQSLRPRANRILQQLETVPPHITLTPISAAGIHQDAVDCSAELGPVTLPRRLSRTASWSFEVPDPADPARLSLLSECRVTKHRQPVAIPASALRAGRNRGRQGAPPTAPAIVVEELRRCVATCPPRSRGGLNGNRELPAERRDKAPTLRILWYYVAGLGPARWEVSERAAARRKQGPPSWHLLAEGTLTDFTETAGGDHGLQKPVAAAPKPTGDAT